MNSKDSEDAGLGVCDVYDGLRPREARRVWAVKGQSQAGKPLAGRPTRRNKGSVSLVPVGTDAAKDLIFSRLKLENGGPGFIHFPGDSLPLDYFDQLTAERALIKFHKGVPRRIWKQIRARNEALDCFVYALVALRLLNPNSKRVAEAISPDQPEPQEVDPEPGPKRRRKRTPKKRGGGWTQNW